jgi:hypothetical protein
MKNLDENTFYIFAIGALYILANIFKSVDRSISELSEKISEIDSFEFPEVKDQETQTEDHQTQEEQEPIIVENPKIEPRSKIFGW